MSRFIKHIAFIFSITFFLFSCETDQVLEPPEYPNSRLNVADPIFPNAKGLIEGIYVQNEGVKKFGDTIVLKWTGETLSVFCRKDADYMIMKGGELDTSIVFEGYWRSAFSRETGIMSIEIFGTEGAVELKNGIKPGLLKLRCKFGSEIKLNKNELIYKYAGPLKSTDDFLIIAHRGGGRTSDLLPASENSVELIRFCEKLGANGIEIDIRLTADGIPILYHDEKFNSRLINGDLLIGDVSNYQLYQIRNFCTLKQGEMVPTLEEALEAVVDETNLKFVWLDIKSTEALEKCLPIQKKYLDKAAAQGRELFINLGLPTDEIYSKYKNNSKYHDAPAVCEIGREETSRIKYGKVGDNIMWAPRWTLGLLNDHVDKTHAENMKAVVWTLDQPDFIYKFINEGKFDGILTNHPTLVAFEYYVKN